MATGRRIKGVISHALLRRAYIWAEYDVIYLNAAFAGLIPVLLLI